MYFVLEESSWTWDGGDWDAFVARIEGLLARLEAAHRRGEGFAASRTLLEHKILGAELGQILWSDDIPQPVREEITARFFSMHFWDDEIEAYPGLDAHILGAEVFSPSAVFVHARVGQGELTACLPLPGTYSGPCAVVVGARAELVHFVTDESTHLAFFRDAIEENGDERTVEALAPHAYPGTFFLTGVWRGLRDFDGGFLRVRATLLRFLQVFDDYGAWVFTDETGRLTREEPEPGDRRKIGISNALIEKRFRALGLDVAPEKPNVRSDRACRRARERMLGGRLLYCEWHYKVEPHTNRVHLHAPVEESNVLPIVAIFHGHLPLPGD